MRHLVVVLAFGSIIFAGTAAAQGWADCPGIGAGANCNDPGWNVCALAGGNIVCDLAATTTTNRIYVVEDGNGTAWAYGAVDVTNTNVAFCCSFATYTDLEIYGGSGVDLICLTDASIHHCNDETGDAVADVFDSDSYIECGSGNDRVDTAVSGVHVDEVYGESGEDIIVTYNGADDIDGGADDDTIDCGDGPDKAFGGAGDDTIYGGIGADQLIGGANNDEIYGQSGDDDICGSTGADTLYGGANDDCICHNESGQVSDGVSDYLEGSTGADQGFWWPGTPDFDTDDGSITLLETCTCDCP